jgi:hypothetical protein
VYADEFTSLASDATLTSLLAEARKYRVGLVLANQHLGQLGDELRGALFGNVGTLICFKASAEDAAYLAREFSDDVSPTDITNLPHHDVYLKLVVNGVTSSPFSATTLRPSSTAVSYREQITRLSRERYARPRLVVERHAEQQVLASRGRTVPMAGAERRCFPSKAQPGPWPPRIDPSVRNGDRRGRSP